MQQDLSSKLAIAATAAHFDPSLVDVLDAIYARLDYARATGATMPEEQPDLSDPPF